MTKACKACHLIVESEAACPLCGAAEFSERFNSIVQVFDASKSEIAAKLGAKGRYWISRCLLDLGQALEDAGRFDEAQRAYQMIVDQHLGGATTAQDKLARFRVTEGTKP